jgi:hypothetical protein
MNSNANENYDSMSTNSTSESNQTLNDINLASSSNSSYANLPSDQNKYEKIIQDYVKVRSKLAILKKAYVELSDSSAQKDQSMRKQEQEIEGLNFRNQQLTARVEMLQRELDILSMVATSAATNAQNSSGLNSVMIKSQSSANINNSLASGSFNASSQSAQRTGAPNSGQQQQQSRLDVLTEELTHKINENTILHKQLSEMEVDFRQKLTKSEQILKQYESDKLILEKKIEINESTSKQTIEKLQNDKIKLELNVIQLENQLRTIHKEKEQKELELRESEENLIRKQFEQQKEKEKREVNAKAKESQDAFLELIKSQQDHLAKLYLTLSERASICATYLPKSTNNLAAKYAAKCEQLLIQSLVPKVIDMLKLNNSQEKQHEKVASINTKDDFERSLNDFFEANNTLFTYYLSEDAKSSEPNPAMNSSDEMDVLNKKIKIYLNKLYNLLFINMPSQFTNTSSAASLSSSSSSSSLSSISLSPKPNSDDNNGFVSVLIQFIINTLFSTYNSSSNLELNSKIAFNLNQINDILEKILFVYNEKLSLEYSLNYQPELTTVDECVVSYLTQFRQTLIQIVQLVQTNNSSNLSKLGIIELSIRLVNKYKAAREEASKSMESFVDVDALKVAISSKDAELKQLHQKLDSLKEKSQRDFDDSERLKYKLEKLQTQYLDLQQKNQIQQKDIQDIELKYKEQIVELERKLDETKLNQQQVNQEPQILKPTPIKSDQSIDSNNLSEKEIKIKDNSKVEILAQSNSSDTKTPKSVNQNQKNEDDQNTINNKNKKSTSEEKELENFTNEFYMKKIESLSKRIQLLDSKAFYYYDEMKCMLERLKLQVDVNNLQESELNEVKDQLERTRNGYEVQMSTLSEHIIEMTNKMTEQAEENEKLKHELNTAPSSNLVNSSATNSGGASSNSTNKSSKSKKSK